MKGPTSRRLALGSAQGSKIVLAGQQGEEFLRDRTGTEVVSAADLDGLRAIAGATGGRFLEGSATPQALVQIYEVAVQSARACHVWPRLPNSRRMNP